MGWGGVTSTRSPTPSMFDCPASTQRSPTNTGPTSFITLVVFLDRQVDRVRTTDGYADKLAFEESDPIGKLFVGGRILVLRDDGCVDQRGVLGGLVEREGDHPAAVDVALKDLRGHRRLDLDLLGHRGLTTKAWAGARGGVDSADPTTPNATIRAPSPLVLGKDANGHDRDMVV